MPPAEPPRDPARPPDDAVPGPAPRPSGDGLDPHPADGGLRVEVELLLATVNRLSQELAGLQQAMASRAVIDQAKGALRAVTGLSSDEAFTVLATRSQNTNRKLSTVALEVLTALDGDDRRTAIVAALRLPEPRPLPAGGEPLPDAWRSRRRQDPLGAAVTDPAQVHALADLAEQLAAAPDRRVVVDVLLREGAECLGAFAAALATAAGDGTAAVELEGVLLSEDAPTTVLLDADHPSAEALRTRQPLLLSRADLALRYPEHPRPDRLRGLAVLPVGGDTASPAAWSLYFDHPVPGDRSGRAMLDRAARLASRALARAR